MFVEKIGKINDSPARRLGEIVDFSKASVLLGHVRMPLPEFISTARFKETAQPCVVERDPKLTVTSVHNGNMENYRIVKGKLGSGHVFESEKFELIDSEVAHIFSRRC